MNASIRLACAALVLTGFAASPSALLRAQTAIPAAFRVSSGVNTNAPGVLVRTYQVAAEDNLAQVSLAELELAGGLGPNVANLADANYPFNAATGYFEVASPVNFRHDAGSGSDNGEFVGPDYPDAPIPGLPGTLGSSDQAAAEAIAFLEFSTAGLYEMGVSSDDCASISVGHNPRDRFALTLGGFTGARAMGETRVILFNIPAAGIYPFRCLWANQTGETGWEWYIFDANGNRLLINDPTNKIAKAYREGPLRPYVVSISPDFGEVGVSPTTEVVVEIQDEVLQLESVSIQLRQGTASVAGATSINRTGNKTTARFVPAAPLELSTVYLAELVYTDNAVAPLTITNTWPFRVSTALISAAAAVPRDQVDTSVPGFRVFTHQLAGADAENLASLFTIRNQLEGLMGENLADLSLADADGFFHLANGPGGGTQCINFNDFYGVVETGNFTSTNGFPDLQYPGTPGSGGLDWTSDNLAIEVLTYLEFPTMGTYTLGINSIDSFSLTIGDGEGRGPKDLFATVLAEYDGDYLDNYLFSIWVPAAGIYPMRLIQNIGIQQGDLEWFSSDASGADLKLINAPGGLKGYLRGPALPAYVRRVSPGPNVPGLQDLTVTDVPPTLPVFAEIMDEGTTVLPGNVSLRLDGRGQSTATKAGKLTTVTVTPAEELLPGTGHEATLVYTDSAGKTITNRWTFRIVDAVTLDPALSYPPGSGDPNKTGFAMRVVQLALPFVSGENGSVTKSEGMLAGVFLNGENVANLADPKYISEDGWFQVSTINFGSGVGAITPDDPMPGIPGSTGHTDHFAAEIRTYLEFPAKGVYNLSLYSDDSPRLFQAEAQQDHFGALEIVTPCSAAGTRITMTSTTLSTGSGFGGDLPTTPLILPLVVANPILGNFDLANAAAIKDSAALLKRGDVAFGIKAARAKAAGAKAVIVFNNETPADRMDRPPVFMGGTAAGVDIPCLFIGYRDGTNLVRLAAAGEVTVNVQENPAPLLFQPTEGYYGGWDFSVYAPQPGLYPFRLVTGQGGGDYGIEWSIRNDEGTRILLNDPSDPVSLKAFRAVIQAPQMAPPGLGSGCTPVEINWRGSGTLLEAGNVGGPYQPSASQRMPHTDGGQARKFYKVEQMK
jgi:hypothetical protein